MRASVLYGPRDIRLDKCPDPALRRQSDAIVQVTAAAVCGSDLWRYRGVIEVANPRRMGHEFVGIVAEVGTEVCKVRPGDVVVAPFNASDGTCSRCIDGVPASCARIAYWGGQDEDGAPVDAGQGEYVRVPLADGTLVVVPGAPETAQIPDLLTLSDVMATGHHAAVCAGVDPGRTVAVVGDGAVGLCGILAARRLGAERIIVMSRHSGRQRLALQFGATDIVGERGVEGIQQVMDLLDGTGADSVLECVGTRESMEQAIGVARPGGGVGYVGIPAGGAELPIDQLFYNNIIIRGGPAAVRTYLPDLLRDVLAGEMAPGLVFDLHLPLSEVAAGYAAMDERRCVKALLRP